MKTMKRILTLLLALTLVLGMAMPVFTVRVEAAEISGDWEYTLNSGVATITRYIGTDSVVTVPKMFGNYLVNAIGEYAFENNSVMQKVILHDKIITIGNYAFSGCVGLNSIVLPEELTSLGTHAFENCVNVSSITVNSKQIADCGGTNLSGNWSWFAKPFYGVGTATDGITLTFASGCRRVPAGLFYASGEPAARANLKTVILSDTVTTIADHAFDSCDTISNVKLSENIEDIGQYAFSLCTVLERVDFMGNAPVINETAFNGVTTNCYYRLGYNWTGSHTQNYGGTLTWNCIQPTPSKPYKITNVVSGVHVYWNNVPGVAKYGLWRSETGKNGTYKWVANPTVAHFTDTKVESGKTYYYKVTTMDGSGKHSEKSDAIGITYVSTPDIASRANTAAGVKLSWNKVTGATGYAIYRKSYSGSDAWVRVGTITGNSTFTWTDTSVKNDNGTAYKYTIRALAGSNMKTLSGCRNTGRTMVRLSSQVLTSAVKAGATSIKCKWTTSSWVTGYEVRFIVDGEVVKTYTIGNYKTGIKTFTGLESGHTYTIQVRTYKKVAGVGSFYSDWSTVKTVSL